MEILLAAGIFAIGAWLALTVAKWIREGEDAGIVNRGYVGEDSHGEGKTDL